MTSKICCNCYFQCLTSLLIYGAFCNESQESLVCSIARKIQKANNKFVRELSKLTFSYKTVISRNNFFRENSNNLLHVTSTLPVAQVKHLHADEDSCQYQIGKDLCKKCKQNQNEALKIKLGTLANIWSSYIVREFSRDKKTVPKTEFVYSTPRNQWKYRCMRNMIDSVRKCCS